MAALSILSDIMRILTPEEISELTTSSSSVSMIDLTEVLDMEASGQSLDVANLTGEGAKILPFGKSEEEESVSEDQVVCGPNVAEFIEHHLDKIKIGETARGTAGEAVETSVFILKEKERFQYVQGKLKKKEVMSLYLKNASVDIEQEKTLKDDLSKSSRSGVLVNKKQF